MAALKLGRTRELLAKAEAKLTTVPPAERDRGARNAHRVVEERPEQASPLEIYNAK
jgi:hypothetical protein